MNLAAGLGVAVREFRIASGHGFADSRPFDHGEAIGVDEAFRRVANQRRSIPSTTNPSSARGAPCLEGKQAPTYVTRLVPDMTGRG